MMIVSLFFSKYNVTILKNNTIIITGKRNTNGLWDIPLTAPLPPPPKIADNSSANSIIKMTNSQTVPSPTIPIHRQANGVLRMQKTKQDLAKYTVGSLFNPHSSTLLRTIRLIHLLKFLGIATSLITKRLPANEDSLKRHLAQEQKNLRSTKPPSAEEDDDNLQPKQEPNNMKTNKMMCAMFPVSEIDKLSKSYLDQTGGLPVRSATRNKYMCCPLPL